MDECKAIDEEEMKADDGGALVMNRDRLQELLQILKKEEEVRYLDCKKSDNESQSSDDDLILENDDGSTTLVYDSYLEHQKYYDDMKHIDVNFIDFGQLAEGTENLVIEQKKDLGKFGKGGMCWDSGFILFEHLVSIESTWNSSLEGVMNGFTRPVRVVELGSGTGVTGLALAKSTYCHVVATDLPDVAELIHKNLVRNFYSCDQNFSSEEKKTDNVMSRGTAEVQVLRWGVEDDYIGLEADILIGADVVTSIYDEDALLKTITALSSVYTKVYLAYRSRITEQRKSFETKLKHFYRNVCCTKPSSRNRHPDIFIFEADTKK
mmetsp:Transcript_28893/g.29251  ORF Transcript_28893/g.29251 Transcript_28893/m.29251 type:complete len:322 (-) Transcript_28893:266-1231(-)|eukprot:CAMPEP_0171300762 /NCGR_PEP_ID=MMETSP0816-20121228/9677_1 /TAXON_ID=420281 /ORGANISM="Proboscia inermis, Strain CCAP1064/1" /LENGTH=321 /DNA_ID=CAMNT_0011777609 /DNA_START=79 /DNA_END=1044 /DNA_ORIENTATION=-